MSAWGSLIDEAGLAAVLPHEYAHFARPIRDGLIVFLEGLPADRQTGILNLQASLPFTASLSERLAFLARSCPVLHKLGQIVARDQRLSLELREQLQQLESLPPTVSLETIQEILDREVGSLDQLGVTLAPPAIAEASVAVVIPFDWKRGSRKDGSRQGVFKILKPGIEERLKQELVLMDRVGSHLDQRCEDLQIPHLDYQESFQQVRDKLWYEIQLDQEQSNIAHARAIYAGEPSVQIPALLDGCTPRVTAMERVTGGKVTDHRLDSAGERRQLAALVVKSLIAQPIFSKNRQALFHSDPHAGNLFLTDENRLAILDWSLVGSLGERERVAIVQIMLGALTLRAEKIVAVLSGLAERQNVDRPALWRVVRRWLRRMRQGQFPGLSWLIGMLDDAVQNARLRVAADLMLFRKSLHTLEGVVAELGPDGFQVDDVLCREFLRNFVVEWPRRWLVGPTCRKFATRLSNADLTQTALSIPMTATRFWLGQSLDLLDTRGETAWQGTRF